MQWFEDGDRNTRFFHGLVKGRRKRLKINKMMKVDGSWAEGDKEIAEEVCFFKDQFTRGATNSELSLLQYIHPQVEQEENDSLIAIPHEEEIRKVVFELNAQSACGPDGLIHDMLEGILPKLISPYQSKFVKGRNITENVLLAQEIISEIRKRGKPANVAKSYDGGLKFLISAHGFFHSTKGVKQRDPLSPALFILSAEVLTRALNHLFYNNEFKSFGLPKWSDQLNHLAYADDTIIFTFADKKSMQLIMKTLQLYEAQSGQLINKEKSLFYMFNKTAHVIVQEVEDTTGFMRESFPLTYLGCPIEHAKKKKEIRWEPGNGQCSVWFDNWTQLGALHYYLPINHDHGQLEEVQPLMLVEGWNNTLLHEDFAEEVSNHITSNLGRIQRSDERDKPWWMPTSTGKFSVGSSFESKIPPGDGSLHSGISSSELILRRRKDSRGFITKADS
ncbi:uncharacterized protein LOC125873924 [Solanum stenotomum]|uniref:uncharacterized protein LOC125873924 n=1 Tax=Solanum stenotomum TaxID=172797 RepID=UPI0020D01553|nr:uncharacterized protein LOC125873924 [Solanum stenotomum]